MRTPLTGDGGLFGSWSSDVDGLPCFDYAMDLSHGADCIHTSVMPPRSSGAPWHLVANPSLIALARTDGQITLYSAASGLTRLTKPGHRQFRIDGQRAPDPTVTRFGTCYVEYQTETGTAEIRRRIWLLPDGPGALRIDTRVEGASGCAENWPLDPYPIFIGGLMSRRVPSSSKVPLLERLQWDATMTATSVSRLLTDGLRTVLGATLRYRYTSRNGAVFAEPNKRESANGPALYDPALPVVYLAPNCSALDLGGRPTSLAATAEFDASADLSVIVGIATSIDDAVADIESMRDAELPEATGEYRRAWSLGFGAADSPDATTANGLDALNALERESAWHAACLRNLEVADDYFEARYPSQASAYSFIHGAQGAPRDYALSAVPLAMIHPDGARDALEVMMRMTRPNGAMHYAHTGRGRVLSGGIHSSPSDLPIFLLWALTEYVFTTGDREFLDAEIPFYPKEHGTASTVGDRVRLAFTYLRDHLGCEEHGMLRVGSGDWSDPISSMAPDRKAFHEKGGSGFNTAFAAYALPRAGELLGGEIAIEMNEFAGQLRDAMEEAWAGRWFYRGWDGLGSPLGNEHLFLDGQVFCLIGGIGSDDQRGTLAASIKEKLMDPSAIGATILDRPHRIRFGILPPGWDCNGGVWAAMNGLAAWGLSLVDAQLGWECLEKQTLAAHARAYPHIWYGIWSGPDAYNSWMGDREGETFVQPATPMAEFPQPNSNAHAGPLLGLLRVLGIEATPEGLAVQDRPGAERLPFDSWQLATAIGQLDG